jgi:dTDP-4-dehydrorhamnose reductase
MSVPGDSTIDDPLRGGRVLLIGAGGMLGRAWRELLGERGIDVAAPPHAELDLSRSPDFARHLAGVRLVINCAAWNDVDGAEEHAHEADTVNGHAVGALAQACAAAGATLVHYSSDYVFDGDADTPYRIDHPTNPVSAYGRSKALGERLVTASGCDALTIRTSWLYAPWGRNFVSIIADLVRTKESIHVVDDQRGRPTSARHLAAASWELLVRGARGIHHVCDGGQCTRHAFAETIARLLGSACQVIPCSTDAFPRPARRPAYSVLDLTDTEAMIGPMPPWQSHLGRELEQMESVGR